MSGPYPPPPLALELLRAEHGSCLLMHYGQDLLLVDGGPAGVYDATLAPRLTRLAEERGRPLRLRLIMVSHNDGDHIAGLADMLADARKREQGGREPQMWRADELWFNSFALLTGTGHDPGAERVALQSLIAAAPQDLARTIAVGVAMGTALREDAAALGIDVNKSAAAGLVMSHDVAPVVEVAPGLTFTVLAPSERGLLELRRTWAEWAPTQAHQADAWLAARVVTSAFDRSGIAVLARTEKHSILLTGRTPPYEVLVGLQAAGLLNNDGTLTVDILTVPYQGRAYNLGRDFFERVRARHYVVSTDGRDGTPDDETLDTICDIDRSCTLWLTYGGEPGDGQPGLHERLSAFLERRGAANQLIAVRFPEPGEPHLIALE